MSAVQFSDPWIMKFGSSPEARLRLICFPYAGGSAYIFAQWSRSLPASVEVCAVQSPGRGNRVSEKPFASLASMIPAVVEGLKLYLDSPFCFFGHSMGALIAFELTRELRRTGKKQPEHLFVSGSRAPQFAHEERVTYNLPESDFFAELHRLNGTPKEALDNPELRELIVPLLRADFAITQTYKYREERPFTFPLTVFGGQLDEEFSSLSLQAWRRHTTGPFEMHRLPGDHFFLNSSRERLLQIIAQALDQS